MFPHLASLPAAGRMEPRYIYFILAHQNKLSAAVLKELPAAAADEKPRSGQPAVRQTGRRHRGFERFMVFVKVEHNGDKIPNRGHHGSPRK